MEVILYLVLIYGGLALVVYIFQSIADYFKRERDRKNFETRELVFQELLGDCEVQKIFTKCKTDIESLGYDIDSEQKKRNSYLGYFRTAHQELLGKCPCCASGFLRVRKGKFGKFIGCSSYPRCQYTIDIKSARGKYSETISDKIKDEFKKAYL